MRPLCVIPARRGSKRLALKNILPLGGRPMLHYTIDAAVDSGIFDEVFVSTEDDEIAGIARLAGASVHRRPAELAGDLVSATDVCLDVERALRDQGRSYDAIYCLQPSSPLRSSSDVKAAWERLVSSGADYLVSVTPIDPHYFHWAVAKNKNGWSMYFGDKFLMERPLLPPVYRPNGAIKIGRCANLHQTRNFFGPNLVTHQMPEERSLHVAEPFDFELAQFLIQRHLSAI
jgi:CMP-N,N'-diacetyllegionaminic acid synthase